MRKTVRIFKRVYLKDDIDEAKRPKTSLEDAMRSGRFIPTDAPAGSEEKIRVMIERNAAGFPVFHPDDRYGCYGGDEQED